ncbi:TPA: hypothetical protein DD449_03100 [Candidatus Berkelbacteria bacterium]|uniref:Uncharacterized protein n=1 Tax=Berkelbacteria bacterium GW2011_GWE1_39_12 TaxID=1618337 RepID=A0A0G4B3A5_9BACT|nr:MAG: hypothetical protein UT28_C0001G0249 [Berkelbacteria bacterium GW2011_GWE1_39_12]HBO60645.1 hypothetical protein [Candidatus Berkelbacteria bacterium]
MKQNKKIISKWFSLILIVVAAAVLIGIGWLAWCQINPKVVEDIPKASFSTTTEPSSEPVEKNSSTPSDTTTSLKNFSKTGFSFNFSYPSSWTVTSSTDEKATPNAKFSQETVKIVSPSGIEFRFDNPTVATGFEEYSANHAKDISAGKLTFKRNWGENLEGTTLYIATYNDPQNIDALSVSFYGTGKISEEEISTLDQIIASFKFN